MHFDSQQPLLLLCCFQVKARPSTPSVARQFVVSKNVFEFGPLLLGKDATGYDAGAHPDNTAKMRITNNGLFDLHVDFVLKSKDQPADAKGAKKPAAKPAAKGGKGQAAGLQLDDVFVLSPASLDLKVDETQELTVYGFPVEVGADQQQALGHTVWTLFEWGPVGIWGRVVCMRCVQGNRARSGMGAGSM